MFCQIPAYMLAQVVYNDLQVHLSATPASLYVAVQNVAITREGFELNLTTASLFSKHYM